ncbi:ATP-binding protein [Schaalia suimastitidis]|uniref:ATP-binding protein n=1 Tax=Schaalia suimastitidis TaxID=121163 RepID=UPI0003FDD771|nr:ATP-binding protein [Schaalia suimastitidis]
MHASTTPNGATEEAWRRTYTLRGGHKTGCAVHVLVIGDDSKDIARALTRDMAQAFPNLCLDHIDNAADIADYNASLGPADHVVLGLITSATSNIDPVLESLTGLPILEFTKWLVVTVEETHSDLSVAMSSGRLASVVTRPWTVPVLLGQAYSVMVQYLQAEGRSPEQILELIGPPPETAVQGPLLEGLDKSETQVVRDLLEGVERVIGRRPRLVVPAGTELTRQGSPVSAVYLVLEGHVSLHRDSVRGEVLAHHATSGPLIGLVSLARNEDAFFTSVTTTPARVVRLTNEQLQLALDEEPELSRTLTALTIQSLTRRLMRAEDLHLENATLAEDLEKERVQLAKTLAALEATREELVERTRFAMLGELSAGIAHELNNPVTALVRSAEHLAEDIKALLEASPQLEASRQALVAALEATPRSTSVERQQVADLVPIVGDRQLARRLVRAGIVDPRQAADYAKGKNADRLAAIESGARAGSSLRAALAAGERVIELTQSLKGYARPDADEMRPVDVREGLDDVLRLTKHRLRGIEVECDYADVPLVRAHPGKLQQVWTNLLVNAAEALDDEAEDVRTRADEASGDASLPRPARGDHAPAITASVLPVGNNVVVEIHDNGPGIPTELLDKIFEPHFTTKAGRVRYGLGMGMSISRSIVADIGGSMTICSSPGDTRIRVSIPALGN